MSISIFSKSELDRMWSDHLASNFSAADVQYLADTAANVYSDSNATQTIMECLVSGLGYGFSQTAEDMEHAVTICAEHYNESVNEKDSSGRDGLHNAAVRKSHDIMDILVANGADLDSKDKWGDASLHMSCYRKDVDGAKILLDAGADPEIENNWHETPLIIAEDCGCTDLITLIEAAIAA